MKPIARIHTDFADKFGVPRQSGLVEECLATITFEKEYRIPEAIRGLDQFSHIWLIWDFSFSHRENWSPTVRPPKLGGNTRLGVFATRSPFRPNPIGLSAVRLIGTEITNQGPVLTVAGADLVDGTPIFDIKPYIPFTDCRPEATEGYTRETYGHTLQVIIPETMQNKIPAKHLTALTGVLAQDPRPGYSDDPLRVYGITFAGMNVRFTVEEDRLTVTEITGI